MAMLLVLQSVLQVRIQLVSYHCDMVVGYSLNRSDTKAWGSARYAFGFIKASFGLLNLIDP